MGFLSLFAGLGLQTRILIIGAALAIFAATCFGSGYRLASAFEKARAAEALAAQLEDAQKQAGIDRKLVESAEKAREVAIKSSALAQANLAKAIAANPSYKELRIDPATKAAINAALRGDAK